MRPSIAILLPLLLLLTGCPAVLETDRPAPLMNAIRDHEKIVTTRPVLIPLLQVELDARREYYDSIGTTDARYAKAKRALAKAVDAMNTASGGGK